MAGLVDSGADGTLLPKIVARRLGIESGLVPNPKPAGAAGGQAFQTWKSPERIHGRVIALLPDGPREWGPEFSLVPVFAKTEMPLYGRADFFKVFTITFQHQPLNGSVFMLDG